ncbi:MAG TPA: hypothetical protein VJY39_04690 [Acidisphaera sp.]|nr:hypothetical protein [Acidisphaera sp.]
MAEQTTIVTDAETPEAFLASREQFWKRWTHFVVLVASLLALLLICLDIFLV